MAKQRDDETLEQFRCRCAGYTAAWRSRRRGGPPEAPPPAPEAPEAPEPEPAPSAVAVAHAEARQRAAEEAAAGLRARLRASQEALAGVQATLDAARGYRAALGAVRPMEVGEADPHRLHDTEATAVLTFSDWHVGEVVQAAQVNGLNEYTPEIAERRAGNAARNAVKLIMKEARGVAMKRVVVGLLGDFITGHIHRELIETNAFSPADEAMFATRLLLGTMKYILENTPDYMQFDVVCKSGNHGRMTEQKSIATAEGNSLEAVMYGSLSALLSSERVRFHLSPSYHHYVNIHGVTHRFHHGDEVRYNGGTGTITIPLMKSIAAWDSDLPAHYDVMGHFHNRFMHRKFLINGSLIGVTPYGRFRVKGSSEPPTQSFHLVDSHRGITGHWPIWVLD